MAEENPNKQNEVSFEVGMDEWYKQHSQVIAGSNWANIKRTYDEYQNESLESVKRNRSYVDKVLSDANNHTNNVNNIAIQALQNAVETANVVGKQSIQHRDIAADNHWNPLQQGAGDTLTAKAVNLDDASLKAIGGYIAQAMANSTSGRPPVNPSGA